MKDGFIKVMAATPKVVPGDIQFNIEKIIESIEIANRNNVKILFLPRLAITGASLGSLFCQNELLSKCISALKYICSKTKKIDILITIGLPLKDENKIYDAYCIIKSGEIIAFHINSLIEKDVNYQFDKLSSNKYININGKDILLKNNLVLKDENIPSLTISFDKKDKASIRIISKPVINTINKNERIISEVLSNSYSEKCACIFVSNSINESSSEGIFGVSNLITENGIILNKGEELEDSHIISEIDLEVLNSNHTSDVIWFNFNDYCLTNLTRIYSIYPYLPNPERVGEYSKQIIKRQSLGILKRLNYINSEKIVIGLSGGLDSTSALIAAYSAFKMRDIDTKNIIGVTMPGFGTTKRTFDNTYKLAKLLNITLLEKSINELAEKEFEIIGHNKEIENTTFENTQARIRTLILMDIAGKNNTIVLGTSDLSEIALGWSTYNGDHMSMYCVNAGIPKSIMKLMIKEYAINSSEELRDTLMDILDTKISPELTSKSQDTQEIIGPYILNDFILYYAINNKFKKDKIKRIAKHTFSDKYKGSFIENTIDNFFDRFIKSQYKRSCMPDGIKIFDFSLSPRMGYNYPSDISSNFFS